MAGLFSPRGQTPHGKALQGEAVRRLCCLLQAQHSAGGTGRGAVPDGYRALPTANDNAERSTDRTLLQGSTGTCQRLPSNQTPCRPPGTLLTHRHPQKSRTPNPALLLSRPALIPASCNGQLNYPWASISVGCTPRRRPSLPALGFICVSVLREGGITQRALT